MDTNKGGRHKFRRERQPRQLLLVMTRKRGEALGYEKTEKRGRGVGRYRNSGRIIAIREDKNNKRMEGRTIEGRIEYSSR